jgi:uncharacterized DUF497 family protein
MKRFEYDSRKAAANLRKHGVGFEEAITCFFDTNAISDIDHVHSLPGDERFTLLGVSTTNRLLFIVHNEDEEAIRIISARAATRTERALYEEI